MTGRITVVIISGNEESIISSALESSLFADEIVLVAANSTDTTKDIAHALIPKIKIVETNDEYGKNFAKWRNLGLKNTTSDWLFYLDADEVITPSLQEEIQQIVTSDVITDTCFAVPRANFFLGKRVRHGGTYPDYVRRLYHTADLKEWQGILHEQPIFTGTQGYLKNDLEHYTHRDLSSMLSKTLIWTDSEAKALFNDQHPPVVWWRFIRMMATKIWERLIVQQMYLDGTIGWISVIFETFDTFIIYARLWELQQHDQKSRHL